MKDLIKEDPSLMEAMEEAPEVKWLFEEEIAPAVTETVESVSNATGEIESLGDADFDDEPSPELEDEIIGCRLSERRYNNIRRVLGPVL